MYYADGQVFFCRWWLPTLPQILLQLCVCSNIFVPNSINGNVISQPIIIVLLCVFENLLITKFPSFSCQKRFGYTFLQSEF